MTFAGFLGLALQTIKAPRDVARLLLSARLSSEALWTAFALVVVLNTLVFSATIALMPQDGFGLLGNPVAFMVVQAAALAGAVIAIASIGRAMGGKADLAQVAVLLIWLQSLRVLAQAALMIIGIASQPLAAGLALGVSVLGIWLSMNFIDEAHELGSLFKSAGVLILALMALAVGLSLLLSLLGVVPQGMNGYV
ncbi:YIP1 family protein [Thalassococcus lentus]|uniref:YIP1 family protein n=1 Tax=Thalassococcus lentus TaxID=1210524 RepID=A0ABT4XVK4_9RHOB|nr:YIP1 family protein [Thalassococcus lentus]MDA7426000.1 YIP1 family protein [Thalassococcus lentus]